MEKGGYTFVDVRPPVELEETGRVAGAINIPLVHVSQGSNWDEGGWGRWCGG